ncbi:MAG: MGH1-like glycoside hydrolase domain-containing protein [Phycisphaerae bacterium]
MVTENNSRPSRSSSVRWRHLRAALTIAVVAILLTLVGGEVPAASVRPAIQNPGVFHHSPASRTTTGSAWSIGSADASLSPRVLVGNIYTNTVTGAVFVVPHKAAFLVRIAWMQDGRFVDSLAEFNKDVRHYHASSPGWKFNRAVWHVGKTIISFQWSRVGQAMVGRLKADGNIRIAIETTSSWKEFTSRYTVRGSTILGEALPGGRGVGRWMLRTASQPVAFITAKTHADLLTALAHGRSTSRVLHGRNAALEFNLMPQSPIYFTAGFGQLPALKNAGAVLFGARRTYQNIRAAAGGSWGNFLGTISDTLGNNRVFNPVLPITSYVATRDWMVPSSVVVFKWEAFFYAMLGSLEDPHRSERTLEHLLRMQRPDGMIPNDFVNGKHVTVRRSQPPVGALCVWKFYQRRPDEAFLRWIYPKLVASHNWWFANNPKTGLPFRDVNRDGLLEYRSGPESGMDDSPMYDNARTDPKTETMELDDVGLNSLWAADAGYLARMAEVLGKPVAAAHFLHQKETMIRRINRLLWNPKAGMYENRFCRPQAADRPIPLRAYSVVPGKPGISGQYYRGTDFNHLVMTRRDRAVDFNWFSRPPLGGFMSQVPMSVRWRGNITPRKTGDYRLVLNLTYPFVPNSPPGFLPSVAGARLWVAGKLLMNHWKVRPVTRYVSPAIHLAAGHAYSIKLEYHRQSGGAMVQLRWQRIGEPKRIFSRQISPTNFYPMIAGAPTEAMAKKMLALLQNRHKFWGRYVIPSIARDDPAFPQQSYWRGSIWAATNYLTFQGLVRFASPALLNRFAQKSLSLFMRNWRATGTSNEYYLATGLGSGDPHYTWGTLLCQIALENICDILPNGEIRLNGTLNGTEWLDHIPIAGRMYDVRVKPGHTILLRHGKAILDAKNKVLVASVSITRTTASFRAKAKNARRK